MRKTKDEILAFRLSKSDKDLKAAKTLMASNDWAVAINRLYYAAFHAVSALPFQNDIKAKAHSGAKAMLELHFVKAGILPVEWGRFYAQLFDERNDSDYEDFAIFTAEDVLPLLPKTQEFIVEIKRLINT
ncbi:HEPN domain-containing protein [Spirosoma endbachense]|uniref:HEPN domain-containing protein n=1 Tax=Spirosoma endbachense TaxID=2666025 RepID=A0A6P1W5T1_9BACT|nr:HEPN domain-containing protein [Spirosoma endbachense]QHV99076.1 HEPN domain-containing protein [Spirosoma endbachense]